MPLARALPVALVALAALVAAGCASSETYERPARRPPTPIGAAKIGGLPARAFFERRAALLVAGATVTASPSGISVHAPAGGAAAALARDGYLLTAARCVDGNDVRVYLYGDETWYAPARVVWSGDRRRSPLLDIAIVKIDVPLPGALEWASPAAISEGADVIGVGYRRGRGPEDPGTVDLTLMPGRALATGGLSLPAEAGEPPLATLLHDIPALEEEGGGAVATREGRLIGIHVGTIDTPEGGRTGVAVQPDPVWVSHRIDEDRKAARKR